MKKRLVKVLALTGVVMMFATGCGKTAICDICGEEGKCKTKEVFGEEVNICGDCQDGLEELGDLFG